MKKEILLLLSFLASISFFISSNSLGLGICQSLYNFNCVGLFDALALVLSPFLAILFFSVIGYFLPKTVFDTWFRFICFYTPVSIFLILITPMYSGGVIYPIEKGIVATYLFVAMITISIIIILTKLYTTRTKKS